MAKDDNDGKVPFDVDSKKEQYEKNAYGWLLIGILLGALLFGMISPENNTKELSEEVDSQSDQISYLNAQIESLQVQIDGLESDLEDSGVENEGLSTQLAESSQSLADLQATLNALEALLAEKNTTIEGLDQDLADLQASLDDTQATLDEAEANLEAAEQEISDLTGELGDATSGWGSANGTIDEKDNTITEKDEIIANLTAQLNQTTEELEEAEDDMEQASQRVIQIVEGVNATAEECPAGGTKDYIGIDDGAGNATADDGVIEADESHITYFECESGLLAASAGVLSATSGVTSSVWYDGNVIDNNERGDMLISWSWNETDVGEEAPAALWYLGADGTILDLNTLNTTLKATGGELHENGDVMVYYQEWDGWETKFAEKYTNITLSGADSVWNYSFSDRIWDVIDWGDSFLVSQHNYTSNSKELVYFASPTATGQQVSLSTTTGKPLDYFRTDSTHVSASGDKMVVASSQNTWQDRQINSFTFDEANLTLVPGTTFQTNNYYHGHVFNDVLIMMEGTGNVKAYAGDDLDQYVLGFSTSNRVYLGEGYIFTVGWDSNHNGYVARTTVVNADGSHSTNIANLSLPSSISGDFSWDLLDTNSNGEAVFSFALDQYWADQNEIYTMAVPGFSNLDNSTNFVNSSVVGGYDITDARPWMWGWGTGSNDRIFSHNTPMFEVYDEMTGWEFGSYSSVTQSFSQHADMNTEEFFSGLQQPFTWDGDIFGWIGDHYNNSLVKIDMDTMTGEVIRSSSGVMTIMNDNGDGTILFRQYHDHQWRGSSGFHDIYELDLSTGVATKLVDYSEIGVELANLGYNLRDGAYFNTVVGDYATVSFEDASWNAHALLYNISSQTLIEMDESNIGFVPYAYQFSMFEFNGTAYVSGYSNDYGRAIYTFNDTGWVEHAASFQRYDLRLSSATFDANGDMYFCNDDVITKLHDDNGTIELTDYDVDRAIDYGYLANIYAMPDGNILIQFLEDSVSAVFDPVSETFNLIGGGYSPQVGDSDFWTLKSSIIDINGATVFSGESSEAEDYTTTSSSILYTYKGGIVQTFAAQAGYGWYAPAVDVNGVAVTVAMDLATNELVVIQLEVADSYSVTRGE